MTTPATIGPFRHHDSLGTLGPRGFEFYPSRNRRIRDVIESRIVPKQPPVRKAPFDAATVKRVADAAIDRHLAPVKAKLQRMHDQVDALKARAAPLIAARAAQIEAERNLPPPSGWVRDAATGDLRQRTTRDVAVAANAAHGRDANGKRPGEPGYHFDGAAMMQAGASINDINATFWGRKA